MNMITFIKKSLTYYRRTHLGVILGAAVSTAVLIAALVVGDSVRYSLERLVLDRLGKATWAMQTGERLFPETLSERLESATGAETAPLLATRGIAIKGNEYRVNRVQVVGVDERFDRMGGCDLFSHLDADEVVINQRLAKKLGAAAGDEILLRFEKPDPMPKDAPLAGVDELAVSQRLRVKAVATEKEFGRYSLQANQVEPYTAFLSLDALQSRLDIEGKANVLLIAATEEQSGGVLQESLAQEFTLWDAGYRVAPLADGGAELRCERVFIDPPLTQRIRVAMPEAQEVVTYLVNELQLKNKSTPYSFVSTANAVGIEKLQAGEIVINSWLAKDLNASVGDVVTMTWFRLGPMRRLFEDTTTFRIKAIVPLSGKYADSQLLPDFPGLSDEENCRDWDAGIPIDLDKIRDKDERYWDDYRGTPKAFISLDAAHSLWSNVFGEVTAIRFLAASAWEVESRINALLDPADFGFVFTPVRRIGLEAAQNSVDFAGLFIGLSFFLIIAALLLTGLLFVFGVEQRSQEIGLLLAVGIDAKKVKRLILLEGAALALLGALAGIALGLVFHQIILWALKTIWQDIVGTSALKIYIKPMTIFIGVFSGMLASLLSMGLAARRQAQRNIADLQKGVYKIDPITGSKVWPSLIVAILSLVAVVVILIMTPPGRGQDASESFFAAGALLLIGGLALTHVWLTRSSRSLKLHLNLNAIGRRNNVRRRSRSVALVGILAAGVFLTFTVGANKTGVTSSAAKRSSGTGGFALWGETALPLVYDLDSDEGKEFYGLELDSLAFVQFKVRDGDEASCLNLHKIANPRLLGVQPEEFDQRGAFTFVELAGEVDQEHPWRALEIDYEGGVIPGIADQTVIQWSLGMQVGDTLHYVDEKGQEFHVRLVAALANSIFQGSLLISADHFINRFPSIGGSRALLIDAPTAEVEKIAKELSWTLQDVGLDLIPTEQRLAEFSTVTNTYLSIFLILGVLGLILGSVGIGVVLLRNVLERRSELAIMRALGFKVEVIQQMVIAEHLMLLQFGILVGAVAALIAVLPALMVPGTKVPFGLLVGALAILLTSGYLWTKLAAASALRGNLLAALRNE